MVTAALRAALPGSVRRTLKTRVKRIARSPALGLGWRRIGSRRDPISRLFGFDRGQPIDRYYIEQFLAAHCDDIRGRVLEVEDATYTRRFGGPRVAIADVLHLTAGNPQATIVGDLATGAGIPKDAFDCIILTQVYQFVPDLPAAVRNTCAALRPGGVLLATVPGISQISRYDMDRWGDFWRLTSRSMERLLQPCFEQVEVRTYGNVRSAVGLLHGLSAEETRRRDLDRLDPDYQVVVAARAVRPPEFSA